MGGSTWERDSPVTVGFQEGRSGAFFASDCFGGAMSSRELASGPDLRDVPDDSRRAAQLLWAGVYIPWVKLVDRTAYGRVANQVHSLNPSRS